VSTNFTTWAIIFFKADAKVILYFELMIIFLKIFLIIFTGFLLPLYL